MQIIEIDVKIDENSELMGDFIKIVGK